jgi:hypothetical protein
MNYRLRFLAFTGAALLTTGVLVPAFAQDSDDLKRGVARISVMDGEVSVRRGDSGDWVAGVVNAPLLTDDRISTGPNSRAELQFDSADILRMGGTAEIRLATLEYSRYQLELAHGTITFRVLRPSNANIEVDTPNISVRPSGIGIYRISVNDLGETELTARAGNVEVFTPHGSHWVSAGQMMIARGGASDPEFQIVAANPPDAWDQWCDSRDRMMTQSTSYQYVPQGVSGAEDLDAAGSWVSYPDYGEVWRPTVAAGWAPYQCGRWVWADWYGWTWVGCEPWGWAPYHYGRWFWGANYGWCWYPGVIGVRHYWSPALVAFFGFGGGGGFGFGFGNIGWVPLAPYEVFHPWWGRGFYGGGSYFNRNINITNVNIYNTYRNARIANGVSGISAENFRNGRFNGMMRPTADQIRSAGAIRGAMPLTPTRASFQYGGRPASYTPRTNENMRFFQHQQPATVQHSAVAQGFGQSGAGSRMQAPAPAGTRPGVGMGGAAGGWRRFGEPAASGNAMAPSAPRNEAGNGFRGGQNAVPQNTRPPQAGGGGGWQRFGEPGGGRGPGGPAYNNAPTRSAPEMARPSAPAPRYDVPRSNAPQAAPRYEAPRFNAPEQRYNAPAAPRNEAPRYNAPAASRFSAPPQQRSAPQQFSAPRGGGGGGDRPAGGGGGGNHGGGGGGSHSGGGGEGHRR